MKVKENDHETMKAKTQILNKENLCEKFKA